MTEQNIQLEELSRGLSADHFSRSYSKNTKNTNGPKFAEPRVAAVSPYFKRSMIQTPCHAMPVGMYKPVLLQNIVYNRISS